MFKNEKKRKNYTKYRVNKYNPEKNPGPALVPFKEFDLEFTSRRIYRWLIYKLGIKSSSEHLSRYVLAAYATYD